MKIDYTRLLAELSKYTEYKLLASQWLQLVDAVKCIFRGEACAWGSPLDPFIRAGQALSSLFELVVAVMEKLADDVPELKSKKRDLVVALLDDMIKLPIPFEWFDGKIIGTLIDRLVRHLNDTWGKDWGQVTRSRFISGVEGGADTTAGMV